MQPPGERGGRLTHRGSVPLSSQRLADVVWAHNSELRLSSLPYHSHEQTSESDVMVLFVTSARQQLPLLSLQIYLRAHARALLLHLRRRLLSPVRFILVHVSSLQSTIMERKSKRKQREELRVPKEVDKTMADHEVKEEEKMLAGFDAAGDHPGVDEIVLDMDGEDLIFAEDTFPSLPDFSCLCSPSPSTLHAKNTVLSRCSSTSSTSSCWSFLQVPYGGRVADVQQQPAEAASVDDMMMLAPPTLEFLESSEFSSDGLDILGDIDLLDLSIDPWEPCSLFHAGESSTAVDNGSEAIVDRAMQPCQVAEEASSEGHGEGVQQRQQLEDTSSDELARVFLDWLRSNKDSISAEDLRSIKLKRATIECADRRLGRTKHGRMQLLKLILTWVQNSHLQRKRHRPTSSDDHQPRPFPNNCNCSTADQNPAAWNPNSTDPAAGSTHPSLLAAYGIANGEVAYPGATAPYPYPHSCGTGSVVVNSQPFSPTLDFVDPNAGPWSSQLASALPSMVPPQYSGGYANQFLGHPMYHQGQHLPGLASATKEARKKRMARQRRLASLHHHRNHHNQNHLQHAHPHLGSTEGAARNWAFWTNSSSSSHKRNHMAETQTPPPAAQPQRRSPHGAASTSEKRQGWKGEKNLKFLLQKVLKQSDVGSLGRIVLPKKEAETHLPELGARDGISIPMEDIGTSQVWNMRYRFWPNNKSRMYLLENTGDFVRSNGLQEGDFIVIYSDVKCGKYMIRGVKVRQPAEAGAPSGMNAEKKAHRRRNSLEKTGGADKMRGNSIIHGDVSP
ncbi:unnamed protein product [Musa acuminata var. zebrina]